MNECIVYTSYRNDVKPLTVRPDRSVIQPIRKRSIRLHMAVFLVALSFFCGFLMQANAMGQNERSVSAYMEHSVQDGGEVLIDAETLPLANPAATPSERPLIIDVGPGDTLWGIANEYAGKQSNRRFINEIVKLNKLESKLLDVGQVLLLPPGK